MSRIKKNASVAGAMPRDPSPWAPWVVAGIVLIFAAVLLLPYFHGHWRLADDSYEYSLPSWRFQERVLRLGQWPHWNLGEGFGKPTGINTGSMFYYPLVPLWGLIVGWSETSYLGFLLLHLFGGGLLAYRFSRRLGLALEASLFFALAYVGNGYVLGFFSNPALLFPYLLWPLLGEGLWDLHQDRDGNRAVAKIALALALIEMGAYPLTKLLIYLSTGLAGLPLIKRHYKSLIAATVIAILCSAPEWATAIRALPFSERMNTDIYDDISYGSPTNFLALATTLIPTAFLRRDGFQVGMAWLERSWWVGALTLAVAFAAYRRGALTLGRYKRFALISLGGLLFAFGGHSFFRELSSLAVPLLEHLRFANMGRVIPMVFLVFMGAAGLDGLQRAGGAPAPDQAARKRVSALWAIFLVACTVGALLQLDSSAQSAGLYFAPETEWTLGALHTAFYLLLAYTVYRLRLSLGSRLGWAAILVGVQFLSLADVGYAFRHLVSKEVRGDFQAVEEPFAPASPQANARSLKAWTDGDDWIRWEGNNKVFNAYTVPYHRWMRAAASDPHVGKYASSLVSCEENAAELGLHAQLPGGHSCAGTQFTINRYYGNTIELSGTSLKPAWILVHDFVDPDWHAELNGVEAPIQAAFGVLKAVEVPAGQNWQLHFEYRNPWFAVLCWISAMGFALLAGAAFFAPFRNRLR